MTARERQVVLVTGGVRRIGGGIVQRLAKDGFAVVIHASARSSGEAGRFVDALRMAGAKADHVIADLGDPRACETLIEKAAKPFGGIDHVVNCASIFDDDRIQTLDAAKFDHAIAVNLRAPLLLAQAFATQVPRGGQASIVNLLDQRVLAPNPLYFSYSVTKAALAAATVTLAQALAPNVRVNAVAPGPVLPNALDGSASFDAEVAKVPLQRAVPIEAIADAVAWLIAARHVTGQTLAVDSGQRLAWETPDVLAAQGVL